MFPARFPPGPSCVFLEVEAGERRNLLPLLEEWGRWWRRPPPPEEEEELDMQVV